MNTPISKSSLLNNIPALKLKDTLQELYEQCQVCPPDHLGACKECRGKAEALRRFNHANIPLRYWKLGVDEDFKGAEILKQTYQELTADLKATYRKGTMLCFAGNFGIGKTTVVCNVLKAAVLKGYEAHYSTLNDIVNGMISGPYEERSTIRQQLMMIDYLAIDEFDPRFIGSDNASDLFGRILEDIFRSRAQNHLPLLMCTNSPNVMETFSGALKQSLSSLMNYVKVVPVIGKDYRKQEGIK
jgi:DNA replication protein DnaC